jgi:hypothetical protein
MAVAVAGGEASLGGGVGCWVLGDEKVRGWEGDGDDTG